MADKYRPSNGTEGEAFMARFCDRCSKQEGCLIPALTMTKRVEDSEYPTEWVDSEQGPTCTAFASQADK